MPSSGFFDRENKCGLQSEISVDDIYFGTTMCVVSKLFHYKDRSSKFFVICALKFFDFSMSSKLNERETREN